jgi:hypothetical protein
MGKPTALATMTTAHAAREADLAKAHEVAERFTGWMCWASRDGKAKIATRTGDQRAPVGDEVWAATLIADSWKGIEIQLAEQAAYDAARQHS